MSLPDKCPFCDAGPGQYVNNYLCGTFMRPNVASRVHQTKVCLVSERTRLAARVAELEALAKQAREDEAWAKANDVTAATMPDGWIAFDGDVRRGVCGKTIMDAIRALRSKMENVKCEMGGAR